MKKIGHAFIGGNFGDEGKASVLSHFAEKYGPDALVVRYNGGSQAGHTVVTKEGLRHVFHHIGSGALFGCPTYLSEDFICHPILFGKEIKELLSKEVLTPQIYAHPWCRVTSPYEMMINQMLEENRGIERHGSVGIGFNETVINPYSLPLYKLRHEEEVRQHCIFIHKKYLPNRLDALGIIPNEEWQERINSEIIRENFIQDCLHMMGWIKLVTPHIFKENIILFEGAQGLLLDKKSQFFPHVTNSHPGLRDVVKLIKALQVEELEATYITRTYTTRHGAGPLPFELPEKPYEKIVDETNVPHPFQGTIRYSYLNLDLLSEAIWKDMRENSNPTIRHNLAVTCMDQILYEKRAGLIKGAYDGTVPSYQLIRELESTVGLPIKYASYTDRTDLSKWEY